jgi:rRNA maturation RNase YbeY
MINIKNSQRKIKFDVKKFQYDVAKLLEILKYADFDIGILLTTNRAIRCYNREFRQKDKATDILSFSYHPNLKAGTRIKPKSDEDKNLGDLVISLEFVRKDAEKWNMTFDERMRVLLVHGMCHLLGYDHISDEDYKKMHKKELLLLKKLN